jgi:hypothetical protein
MAFGQYNRPYRIAYFSDTKSYLITNRGDGKVLQLDSSYKLKTVITGLSDPRDLEVGTIGGNQGLLVVDSNAIVAYDASTFSKLISYPVSGAGEIDDIVVDPSSGNTFYLSDVKNNKILKGKVGPPPFYTPTYTTLVSTGINRPKGMMLNSNGDLIVVTDEPKGKIIKVNTSTGATTTMATTTIDSLNSITEDNEGNYYITNWGDSYLYRCDSGFKNFTKLTLYNKPAGMYLHAGNDLLITLCHLCNKAEYHKLHYFDAASTIRLCEGDSVEVNLALGAQGIGTYLSSNEFHIDISDSNGSFVSGSTSLGHVASATQPKSIKIKLPRGNYGTNHNFRLRSTHPAFVSSTKQFTVLSTPDESSIVDFWSLCKDSKVSIGKSGALNETYRWNTQQYLSDSTSSGHDFTATDTGAFVYTIFMKDTLSGCENRATVTIEVNPDIKLDLNKKLDLCLGQQALIGVEQSPYTFTWTPLVGLVQNTVSNPRFIGVRSQKYIVDVEDKQTGCTGKDSVQVNVHSNPDFEVERSYSTCQGDTFSVATKANGNYDYRWMPGRLLVDSTMQSPTFVSQIPGGFVFMVVAKDSNNCITRASTIINNNDKPSGSLVQISGTGNTSQNNKITVSGSFSPGSKAELYFINTKGVPVKIMDLNSLPLVEHQLDSVDLDIHYLSAYLKLTSDSGCVVYSDTLGIMGGSVGQLDMKYWKAYPNPASGEFHLETTNDMIQGVQLLSVEGRLVRKVVPESATRNLSVDVSSLNTGVYYLLIDGETKSYRHRILVE